MCFNVYSKLKADVLSLLMIFAMVACNKKSVTNAPPPSNPLQDSFAVEAGTRNPLKWPFAQQSIWNMPIGAKAVYVPAKLEKSTQYGLTFDEDYIVLSPDAPPVEIYENYAGWDRNKSRCDKNGKLLFSAPIPKSFIVSPSTWDGLTPNAGLAVLMSDKRTIRQTQPFAFCDSTKSATSQYIFPDQDIYGPGMYGAHGGSGLSAIGGALRLGELTPASGPIRHALKVNVFGRKNLYYDTETRGCRWPAERADAYAENNYGKDRTSAFVKACRMGALLALPASIKLDSLGFETQPGRILAEAFRNYGAYVVDDTGWDVYAIVTEWSPSGRFADEFQDNWGFSFAEASKNTPWTRDIDRIFLNLHVVDNNTSSTIGGGGKPALPLAPPFAP
ncbi:MAG: hypothetical protein H7Y03_07460 [Chitinophagaceae bacterium]|nr:hypothetical protein [Chitinophagaceae bacterium]